MTIRSIIVLILSVGSSRIVLSTLGVEDYGTYNIVGSVIVMLSFVNDSMTVAVHRFLAFALGKSDFSAAQRIYSTSVMLHLGFALIIIIVAETLGLYIVKNHLVILPDRMGAALWVYQVTILSVVFNIISVPNQALLFSHERMVIVSLIELFRHVSCFLLILCLNVCRGDLLIIYAIFVLLSNLMTRVIYFFICRFHFSEMKIRFKVCWTEFCEMLHFSLWYCGTSVAYIAKLNGTNIVINLFFGTLLNAAYGIALQVSSAVTTLSSTIIGTTQPRIIKLYASGEIDRMFALAYRSMRLSLLFQIVICTPILLETNLILKLWLTESAVPYYANVYCVLVIVESVIHNMTRPFYNIVNATGKVRLFHFVTSLTRISSIPIMVVALLLFREKWLAIAVTIATTFLTLQFSLHIVKRITGFSILRYYRQVFFPFLSGCCIIIPMLLGVHALLDHSVASRLVMGCFVSPTIVFLFFIFYLLQIDDRILLAKMLMKVTHRLYGVTGKT